MGIKVASRAWLAWHEGGVTHILTTWDVLVRQVTPCHVQNELWEPQPKLFAQPDPAHES